MVASTITEEISQSDEKNETKDGADDTEGKSDTSGTAATPGAAATATTTTGTTRDLRALGWQPHFADQLSGGASNNNNNDDDDDTGGENNSSSKTSDLVPVRITEVRSKSIHVLGEGGIDHLIPITQGQKIINDNEEKVVVAGDWILVEKVVAKNSVENSDNNTEGNKNENNTTSELLNLRIHKILNRFSVIKRKAPGRNTRRTQLIAANLDTVFVVSSCNQDFNVARLERYIAIALETVNVTPVIVLTKKDLLETNADDDFDDDDDSSDNNLDDDDDFDLDDDDGFDFGDNGDGSSWLLDYYLQEAGSIAGGSIPVVCLDARNPSEAKDFLAPWLGTGQTVAFVGSSGVGKSTLVNSLCGFEMAKTGDIHTDSGQGRHTTTRRQLHFLDREANQNNEGNDSDSAAAAARCGILDTPGLRELQLVDASQGLEEVFRDLVELSRLCRFNDCRHDGEPGCAIEAAVERGEIDPDRWARWEKLVAEDRANTLDIEESKREKERKKNRKNNTSHKSSAAFARRNHKSGGGTDAPEGREIRKQGRKKRR